LGVVQVVLAKVASLAQPFEQSWSCIPVTFLSRVFQLADEVTYLRL